MKKSILSMALIMALGLSFTSCRDTKKADSVEDAVENATEAAGDAIEEAAEATGDAVEVTSHRL